MSEHRAGAPSVTVSLRLPVDRQRLCTQADVWPGQVPMPLWQEPQCQQVSLCPRPKVRRGSSIGFCLLTSNILSRRYWDDSQCECTCRATCLPGQEMEPNTCTCLPVPVSTCSIAPVSLSTSHPAKIATYIGLIALTVLGLTIAITLYYIVVRYGALFRFTQENLEYPWKEDWICLHFYLPTIWYFQNILWSVNHQISQSFNIRPSPIVKTEKELRFKIYFQATSSVSRPDGLLGVGDPQQSLVQDHHQPGAPRHGDRGPGPGHGQDKVLKALCLMDLVKSVASKKARKLNCFLVFGCWK